MGNDDFSEKQIAPSSARSEEEAKSKLDEQEEDSREAIPAEVAEALEELPPEQRRMVSSMFLSMSRMSSSRSSALDKKITPEHISQTINNLEKENERDFKRSQSGETTKRLGMGAILVLVLMVFGYAGLTNDKDLAEKVIIAGISGLGGFGAGVAVNRKEP
ncbi:hypothetical protein PGN35_003155 [Nodosilinea sp. PGN35]|uniref:hypothetical protein n=1 Tax=Nodosilinea sp. PGN35 TaxID=3020489 RepID=UPI0023B27371|nr:hypothetical protein [Nodosilinea sp. TSF1-S3]MDF0365616.1 hypothetical protein [Nodosilinea sp. TSF1-S3]